MARNGVIGNEGALPWRLPADLKHFKQLTVGKPVVMGRSTYLSIGRPLPERTNIVLTRHVDWSADGVVVASSVAEALREARRRHGDDTEVCVAGGGRVYGQFLPIASRLELTIVDATPDGDTHFPAYNVSQWEVVAREQHDGDPPYEFRTLRRKHRPRRVRPGYDVD